MVPPWVGEHPDVFNDPNFSITPNKVELCSDMEVSGGGGVPTGAINNQASPLVRHPMAHMLGINVSEMSLPAHDNQVPIPSSNVATAENQVSHVSNCSLKQAKIDVS